MKLHRSPASKLAANLVHRRSYDVSAHFTAVDIAFATKLRDRLVSLHYPVHRVEHLVWVWARTKKTKKLPTRPYREVTWSTTASEASIARRQKRTVVLDLSPIMLDESGDLSVESIRRMVSGVQPDFVLLRHGAKVLHNLELDWPTTDPVQVHRVKLNRPSHPEV